MTIGKVAAESGFSASAIRFYEQAGILSKPIRIGGRRQYDRTILEQLAIVARTKSCGFSLAQTRQLFWGFRINTSAPERWRILADRRLAELDEMARKIAAMRASLQLACGCTDLAECGRRFLTKKRAAHQ